jgi:S1-C subfamily serine protease
MQTLLRLSFAALCCWTLAAAAQPVGADKLSEPLQSMVKLSVQAVPDARSANTLGSERSGNGILIDSNWVLTIGYLILEADQVIATDSTGRELPGVAAGYDHSTGFGLVKLLLPSKAKPMVLGRARGLAEKEPVLLVGVDDVQPAFIVERRRFAASWEYMIEDAILTAPPIENWGGTALVDKDGELIGVGSLLLRDVTRDGRMISGNMVVPIDLLRPILSALKETGRSSRAPNPWLGMGTDELGSKLVVSRVTPDSPAAKAGIQRGDVVERVNDAAFTNQEDFYTQLWRSGRAGVSVSIGILRKGEKSTIKIQSMDRMDFLKPKTTL